MIEKSYIYFIFALLGLGINITEGFPVAYVFLILYTAFNIRRVEIKPIGQSLLFVTASISWLLFCTIIQSSRGEVIDTQSFYFPLKLVFFLIILSFIATIKDTPIKQGLVASLLSVPVFLSILMYFIPSVNGVLSAFYGIDSFPNPLRFGGVFGKDVNALGIYSSLIVFLVLVLKKTREISFGIAAIIIMGALFTTAISGMRSGVLVLLLVGMIFSRKIVLISKKWMAITATIALTVAFLLSALYIDSAIIDGIIDRFSLASFLNDFDADSDGNVATAIDYLGRTIGNREIDTINFIFGVGSSLTFVDNLYIYIAIKYGVPYTLVVLLIAVVLLVFFWKKNNFMPAFVIFYSILIALKGIFVLNASFIIIMLVALKAWRDYENRYCC